MGTHQLQVSDFTKVLEWLEVSITPAINSLDSAINSLDSAINSLDSAINSLDSAINSVDSAINSVDSAINNFGVANDGSATRTNTGSGGSSAPDVKLVHNSRLDRVDWSTTDCMGSDNLPIVMSVDSQIVTLQPLPITELRWNWKKTDFVSFSNKVEDTVNNAPSSLEEASIDTGARFLNEWEMLYVHQSEGQCIYA